MAGLPVLTSPLDAVSEVVTNFDVGRVVYSLAPEDIGAAINTILEDVQALDRMHRNALAAAQKEFCWEQESPQLIHLYRGLQNKS